MDQHRLPCVWAPGEGTINCCNYRYVKEERVINPVNRALKGAAVLLYLGAATVWLLELWPAYQPVLVLAVAGLFFAHLLEFLVVQRRLKKRPAGPGGHLLQTLLFGFLYWWPLLKRGEN